MSSTHSFQMPVQMPFDWQALLAFLRMRAAPGVETVSDSAYTRTVNLRSAKGTVSASHDPATPGLQIKCTVDAKDHDCIKAHVRQLFKIDESTGLAETSLSRDRWLNRYVTLHPGLRVPGGWTGFEVAARAVLGQQISVPAATTLMGRLVRAAGTRLDEENWLFPSPEQVLAADLTSLRIPGKRQTTLKAMAALFADQGEECLARPNAMERLLAISGIGRWTAGYILMRMSPTHDYWPEGDLVLRKALGSRSTLMTPMRLIETFSRWSPYRSYATIHIWRGYVSSKSSATRTQ